jgi:hypothetical protein
MFVECYCRFAFQNVLVLTLFLIILKRNIYLFACNWMRLQTYVSEQASLHASLVDVWAQIMQIQLSED